MDQNVTLTKEESAEVTPGGRVISSTEQSTRTFENYQKDIRKKRVQVTAPIKRKAPKFGRNAKCPCGSQKKIKHCGCRVARMFM